MELQVKTVKAKVNGSFRSEITILNNSTERYLIKDFLDAYKLGHSLKSQFISKTEF